VLRDSTHAVQVTWDSRWIEPSGFCPEVSDVDSSNYETRNEIKWQYGSYEILGCEDGRRI
jgi:hypothetical protein